MKLEVFSSGIPTTFASCFTSSIPFPRPRIARSGQTRTFAVARV